MSEKKAPGKEQCIKIITLDSLYCLEIDGNVIENVARCDLKTSTDGNTEIDIKIIVNSSASVCQLTANSIKQM